MFLISRWCGKIGTITVILIWFCDLKLVAILVIFSNFLVNCSQNVTELAQIKYSTSRHVSRHYLAHLNYQFFLANQEAAYKFSADKR